MNREDVLRMAKEVYGFSYWSLAQIDDLERFAAAIRSATKEDDAKRLDEAADRLLAPKRTNEVDRHTAFILQGHASAIRASK